METTVIQRIKKFLELEHSSIAKAADYMKMPDQSLYKSLKNKSGIPSIKTIIKISEHHPNLDLNWVFRGEFLVEESDRVRQHVLEPLDDNKNKKLSHLPKTMKKVPLVSQKAAAGLMSHSTRISDNDVKDWYVIPNITNGYEVDFCIEADGYSMEPTILPRDAMACVMLQGGADLIQWGRPHVIATRDHGLLVKRINTHSKDGYILAESDNQDYEPIEILRSEITGMAMVVGRVGDV